MSDFTLTPDTIQISLSYNRFAIIDRCDIALLEFNWHTSSTVQKPYVRRNGLLGEKRIIIYIHRTIMSRILGRDLLKAECVDHVDGNPLNNSRANLRLATHSENMRNRNRQSNNTSGYIGVGYYPRNNKWVSRIKVEGHPIHLGYFDDILDAARAYNLAALEYFGEFARLNVVMEADRE